MRFVFGGDCTPFNVTNFCKCNPLQTFLHITLYLILKSVPRLTQAVVRNYINSDNQLTNCSSI